MSVHCMLETESICNEMMKLEWKEEEKKNRIEILLKNDQEILF